MCDRNVTNQKENVGTWNLELRTLLFPLSSANFDETLLSLFIAIFSRLWSFVSRLSSFLYCCP